jgi:hypothetical protein
MSESHGFAVRSGNGWAILGIAGIERTPGVYDVGARLGMATATMVLVVLRAAEGWAPDPEAATRDTAILCREGRILVKLADDSTQQLDADEEWLTTPDRLTGIVNIATGLAIVLLIEQPAGTPKRT